MIILFKIIKLQERSYQLSKLLFPRFFLFPLIKILLQLTYLYFLIDIEYEKKDNYHYNKFLAYIIIIIVVIVE